MDLLCTKVLTMTCNNLTVGFVMNKSDCEEREEAGAVLFCKVKEEEGVRRR